MKENLNQIIKKIEKAQLQIENKFGEVRIIAVSKRQSESRIRDLYSLGVRDFAENYWQEAREKIANLKDLEITWHFIGAVQSKKIKDIVGSFDFIQSLTKLELAEKVSEKAGELGLVQKVLVQVNISGELSKQGVGVNETLVLLHQLKKLKNIEVCGLMVFPPLCENEEETRHWFRKGYDLFKGVQGPMGEAFKYLSMGTSSDYSIAVEEGSNMLRVGETLMGPRA